jgi:cytochrome c biogenesis protein CcmG, thiol:disulfide interchange protein DsbE
MERAIRGTGRAISFVVVAVLLLAVVAHAGPAAPGFRIQTLDGRTIDSKELIGKKVIVLRFQASYCKPCAKESPELSKLVERYRKQDVELVAVHVQDTATDAQRFARRVKATYPIALDPRLTLGNRFGFKGTPFTVVIDKKGEIAARAHGEGAPRRLPRTIDGLLKDSPS